MYLVYTPKDGDKQEWWFDPGAVASEEAEAIEKNTGWDWAEYFIRLNAGSVLARRALLWTFQRRTHNTLRFDDVRFVTGELLLEYDQEEVRKLRDTAAEDDGLTPADLKAMDEQVEQARPGLGKARTRSDASNTPSPSPSRAARRRSPGNAPSGSSTT